MTEYLLVRHATAQSGLASAALTPRGRAEAEALARRLGDWPFDAIWSSDLGRANETAEILLAGREAPELVRSPLLREVEPPPEGLLARDPAGYAAWEKGVTTGLAERLSVWLRTAAEGEAKRNSPHPVNAPEGMFTPLPEGEGTENSRTILVVSHAGPLRVLICLLLGLPPEAHWSFRLDCASLSVVRRGEGMGTILLLNDRCHLGSVLGPVETRHVASLPGLIEGTAAKRDHVASPLVGDGHHVGDKGTTSGTSPDATSTGYPSGTSPDATSTGAPVGDKPRRYVDGVPVGDKPRRYIDRVPVGDKPRRYIDRVPVGDKPRRHIDGEPHGRLP